MYVIETKSSVFAGQRHVTRMLHEMSKAQFEKGPTFNALECQNTENYSVEWERVDSSQAHDYVRRGGIHTTGLWIDNGRIRKA